MELYNNTADWDSLQPLPASKLIVQKTVKEYHDKTREIYTIYMDNMNTSRQLQTEILKGIAAGEDIHSLFLKAFKAILLMTANTAFYRQIEKAITRVQEDTAN